MPTENRWRFFDFLSQSGKNEIRQWLREQEPVVRTKVNALIRNLEKLDRAFKREDKVGLLNKPPCEGEHLIELRVKVNNVQYRPIGWYGPDTRQVTLLLGATEKGDELVPKRACSIAIKRKQIVIQDKGKICEHRLD